MLSLYILFVFFKQKTAYDMRISDWSSDVCSSDLGAAVEGVLRREAAQAARRAPDQHVVALLHVAAVLGDQLAVRRAVDQAGGGGLLPGQVGGLGHQLVGLDQRDLGQPAEVGLEAPDPLLGVEHRVVVAVGRSDEHKSELQSLMRISDAVFCLKKQNI